MRPFGPVPATWLMSTPSSRAKRGAPTAPPARAELRCGAARRRARAADIDHASGASVRGAPSRFQRACGPRGRFRLRRLLFARRPRCPPPVALRLRTCCSSAALRRHRALRRTAPARRWRFAAGSAAGAVGRAPSSTVRIAWPTLTLSPALTLTSLTRRRPTTALRWSPCRSRARGPADPSRACRRLHQHAQDVAGRDVLAEFRQVEISGTAESSSVQADTEAQGHFRLCSSSRFESLYESPDSPSPG